MSAADFDRERFLTQLWAVDDVLVQRGFPATSPWWHEQIDRFVRSGRKRWVIRAGRRAGKSTTLARLAATWAWLGSWSVPAGDIAVIPIISVSKDEASSRLRTIAAVLAALGLEHEQRADEVELTSPRRVSFRSISCTTRATVGFTSIAILGDEVSRWESRDSSANPAQEVLGSLAPTLATQPHGFMALCSSPWSMDDYHAVLFDAGDTAFQQVSFGTSWDCNPTLTEEGTRELEPDERTWRREYAAEPGATVTAALDSVDVLAAFGRETPLPTAFNIPFLAIDASSLRGDAFSYLSGNVTRDGEIVVSQVAGWGGAELHAVSMSDVVAEISARATAIRAHTVFGDQREEAALSALFAQHGVRLVSYAWSETSKDTAMQLLRRLLRERRVHLPDHPKLRTELTSMKARLLPSGRTRYESNGLDYASALVTLMHAIVANDLALDSDGGVRMETIRFERLTDGLAQADAGGGYRSPETRVTGPFPKGW